MASIFDTIGFDGIMRGVLTEMLNGSPTALYPKTHSDSVLYKETSVESALNELNQAHSNLGALLKDTRTDLKDYKETVYQKTKIDELLEEIYERLSTSFVEMTKLAIVIHGHDPYDKDTVDQKLEELRIPLMRSIQNLTSSYQQLANYLTSSYDDKTTQQEKIALLERKVQEFKDSTNEIMYDLLHQFKAEYNDRFLEALEGYYRKDEIDAKEQTRDTMISSWKGDVVLMNAASATEIKDHINEMQATMAQQNRDNVKSECNILEAAMIQQYAILRNKFDTIMGSLSSISSKISNESEYPIADEVMF